jgi:hypothetical protein
MKKIQVKSLDDLDLAMRIIRFQLEEFGERLVIVTNAEPDSRSSAQNRLSWLWYGEAAAQMKDYDTEGYRGYCKLNFGVPIRREKESFRLVYDQHIKPLPYEAKIACMKTPIDFPVTSEMGVKDMARYLEQVEVFLSGLGVVLSKPEDFYYLAMGVK